jgi:steroid delta-isomerase-like uncharacterized protein
VTTDSAKGGQSVRDMIEALRRGKVSRRKLVAALTALGVSAAAAATVAAAAARQGAPSVQRQHLKLHDQHVTRQTQGHVHAMMTDYAEHAIVDDPLFDTPFVGVAAIARRYAAEVASVPDRALTIINRVVSGDQLIVEWEATGTHVADFLGVGGNGQRFAISGVTIITRDGGKIVRESHYFDTAHLRRQIES